MASGSGGDDSDGSGGNDARGAVNDRGEDGAYGRASHVTDGTSGGGDGRCGDGARG